MKPLRLIRIRADATTVKHSLNLFEDGKATGVSTADVPKPDGRGTIPDSYEAPSLGTSLRMIGGEIRRLHHS